jgi:hypothetical protein
MSFLSRAEVQFLRGQKVVSKSYEYKLKSIIKRKIKTLIDQELPLVTALIPNLDRIEFRKMVDTDKGQSNLTKNGKTAAEINHIDLPCVSQNYENFTMLNNDKSYTCLDFIQQKRVRSVVRISRRSSETLGLLSYIHTCNNVCNVIQQNVV